MALVLGRTKHPIGLKASDIVKVERKATEADVEKFHELESKESDAFKVFKDKVTEHGLDMKLVAVHFLLEESKALFFFSSENGQRF